MPQNLTQYSLLISCPGDVVSEVQQIEQVVKEFNERYSDTLGIIITPKHWRKNSYPQSGGKPQELLNKQFIYDCDAAVAVFWTRFGTPTDYYGSGTEEEIEIMLKAHKQVFMYFSNKPRSPSEIDSEEYEKVKKFREKYKGNGIYSEYKTDEEFYKMFSAHLAQHFLSLKAVTQIYEERKPKLTIQGIKHDKSLCDDVPLGRFSLNTDRDAEKIQSDIEALYHTINLIKLEKQSTANSSSISSTTYQLWRFNYESIEIDNTVREMIETYAKHFDIEVASDFFFLGNLSKNKLKPLSVLAKEGYEGTEEEKKKHNLIYKLYHTIVELCNWLTIEEAFRKIDCISLALENNGTAIDEDVDVTLKIDADALLSIDEFPALNDLSKKYLLDECQMSQLFGINESARYNSYDSSLKSKPIINRVHSPSLRGLYERDYEHDYREELEYVFCYSVYLEEGKYVLKIKFDYIKHHTVVAFPTPILLKKTPNTITYSIASKNNPDVIEGTLRIISE